MKKRIPYAIAFAVILLLEILIALFVRDAFIRPYGGDILVTILICCFVRVFFPTGVRLLPVYVFLFAALVEYGQYFDFVRLIGLADSAFFSILLGRSFSWIDILCYGAGCIAFYIAETADAFALAAFPLSLPLLDALPHTWYNRTEGVIS